MKKLTLLFFVCIFSKNVNSQANSISDHARQLLEVTGAGKLGIQMMDIMIESFKKSQPSVPAEFWEELSKEINPQDLVDLIVPIYCKYYSDEEMIKLIEFYKSPLGQKVIEKLPLISRDSYSAGEEWGRKIGEKVTTRLEKENYIQK